jgi:hypothetical protein
MSNYTITPIPLSKRKLEDIFTNKGIVRPFDIWKNELDKVSSNDCERFCIGFTLDSTYGSNRKWFVVGYDINPTHSNPNTRYYMDDIYSLDTLKPISHKMRTNIMKFIQNNYI